MFQEQSSVLNCRTQQHLFQQSYNNAYKLSENCLMQDELAIGVELYQNSNQEGTESSLNSGGSPFLLEEFEILRWSSDNCGHCSGEGIRSHTAILEVLRSVLPCRRTLPQPPLLLLPSLKPPKSFFLIQLSPKQKQ